MGEASDDLQHITSLGGEMARDWTPIDLAEDQLEVELGMMRNECLARANNLLDKETAYRRYSLMAMASLPISAAVLLKPYWFLTETQHRVERMRRPQKVRSMRMLVTVLGTYVGFGIFLWPSNYGFRARADRMQRLAMYFDALSWDAGVLRHQLMRGTIDPEELMSRDAERRAVAQSERENAGAEEEETLAALLYKPEPTEADAEAQATLGTPKEEVDAAFKSQLLLKSDDATEAAARPTVRDPYGATLGYTASEALERRAALAADLPAWSRLFHKLQERRFSLEQMI
jgi:hypothetical protein